MQHPAGDYQWVPPLAHGEHPSDLLLTPFFILGNAHLPGDQELVRGVPLTA